MILGLPTGALLGIGCCVLAVVLAVIALLEPGRLRLPAGRRRPDVQGGLLSRGTSSLTGRLEVVMGRRDLGSHAAVLERAGVHVPLARVALLVGAAALAGGLVVLLVAGPLLALVVIVFVPALVRVLLGARAARRRQAFGNQLEDSLQLLASSLRAGHSLPQAFASVADEVSEPSREEFTRITNEIRVGRDLGLALNETSDRMQSRDFAWVSQAIAINREVGGNLAEVLDRVTTTIRERNQLRRQVSSLSAEGRLSAYILIALPFGIAAFLLVSNPSYLSTFTSSLSGYGLIALSLVMLLIGWLWLRRIIRFDF